MSTQYSGPLTDIDGMVAGDVSDLSKSVPIAWPEAQRICDIPEVREALDAFAADAHEENMLAMASAIMGHAVAQGRAAGLEEAAKWIDTRLGNFMSQYGYDDSETGALEFGRGPQADAKREYVGELEQIAEGIRALSPAPSDAGKVRAYGIYRTNPEENEGKEFFYYAMWHNDTVPGNGERIVPGYFTPDAALSSLEVIGKDDALLTIARDALEEIALAGMSGSGQESEEGMRDWHARRAWQFIGIAARAKTAIDAAIAAQGEDK